MSRLNEDVVLELIGRMGGNMSAICRACSVDRSTLVRFIERRPLLLHAVRDARVTAADAARANLARHVADGKPWAFRLALQSAAPDELDGNGEDDRPRLTNDERLALVKELFESANAQQEKKQAESEGATDSPT